MKHFLTEDSSVEVEVTRRDNVTEHESFDIEDLVEAMTKLGASFDQIIGNYKVDGAKQIVLTVVF